MLLVNFSQDEIKRLEGVWRQYQGWAKLNDKFASKAEDTLKRIERIKREAVSKPVLTRDRIKVTLDTQRSGKKVLEVKGLSKGYGGHLLFHPFDLTILYGERVGIVGPNGSGKTTLLKTLLGLLSADSGTSKIGASVVTGYYAQEQETLPFTSTPIDFVRHIKPMTEPQAIAFLSSLLFSYQDIRTPIRQLSGGEKSRLQLAYLLLIDANFLLLDEPTNNLDLTSIEVLEAALQAFEGTILAISHDRYFLDKIATKILSIEANGQVSLYPGTSLLIMRGGPNSIACSSNGVCFAMRLCLPLHSSTGLRLDGASGTSSGIGCFTASSGLTLTRFRGSSATSVLISSIPKKHWCWRGSPSRWLRSMFPKMASIARKMRMNHQIGAGSWARWARERIGGEMVGERGGRGGRSGSIWISRRWRCRSHGMRNEMDMINKVAPERSSWHVL